MATTRVLSQAVFVRKGGTLESQGTIGINVDDIVALTTATCPIDPSANTVTEIVCKRGKKYYSATAVSSIISTINS